MSIFGFKILSRLIQSTTGDLDRIPKSNEILTMPVEAQKSFQNFWVNFDCTFIDISRVLLYPFSKCGLRNSIFFTELRLSFSVLMQRNKGFFEILVIFGIIVVTHCLSSCFCVYFIISYFASLCLLF